MNYLDESTIVHVVHADTRGQHAIITTNLMPVESKHGATTSLIGEGDAVRAIEDLASQKKIAGRRFIFLCPEGDYAERCLAALQKLIERCALAPAPSRIVLMDWSAQQIVALQQLLKHDPDDGRYPFLRFFSFDELDPMFQFLTAESA